MRKLSFILKVLSEITHVLEKTNRFRRQIQIGLLVVVFAVTAMWIVLSMRKSHTLHHETRNVNLFEHYPADFLAHFAIVLPFPSPSPTGTPQLDSIEINWPKEMEIDSSGFVILRLKQRPYLVSVKTESPSTSSSPEATPTPTPSVTPSINRVGHQSKLATSVPVPVPYIVWLHMERVDCLAHLTGSNFNIAGATPEMQTLENGVAEWRWNISPKQAGSQVMNASLDVQFVETMTDSKGLQQTGTPKHGGVVWLEDLPIKTYKSWLTKDSITLGSIVAAITALLGAVGLSIPWLYERISEQRHKKKSGGEKIGFK